MKPEDNDRVAHIIPDPDSSVPNRDYKFAGPEGSAAYISVNGYTLTITRYGTNVVEVEAFEEGHEDEPSLEIMTVTPYFIKNVH